MSFFFVRRADLFDRRYLSSSHKSFSPFILGDVVFDGAIVSFPTSLDPIFGNSVLNVVRLNW